MTTSDARYFPAEFAPVRRGNRDPRDHWVGWVVISWWEFNGERKEGCYLEYYDEDLNGELEQDVWFPTVEAARQRAADEFGELLGSWRTEYPTRAEVDAARDSGNVK